MAFFARETLAGALSPTEALLTGSRAAIYMLDTQDSLATHRTAVHLHAYTVPEILLQ